MKAKQRIPGIVIAVDPGLSGTGWAVWATRPTPRRFAPAPDLVGVYAPPRRFTWPVRVEMVADRIRRECIDIPRWTDTHLFIEMPEWQGSAKRAMTWTTGDMQKLTFMVGFLAAQAWVDDRDLIPVAEWKGQLPKDVVQSRIERLLTSRVCTTLGIKTHAWDAVGIGLHGLRKRGWLV